MAGKDHAQAVATAAIEFIGSAHGIVGLGAAVSPLVRDLLQLQDEQTQSLKRIEQGVQQLIRAPWHAAQFHLEECTITGRSEKQVKASLRLAKEKLIDALGAQDDPKAQQPHSVAAAYIKYDLAVVSALAGDKNGSRHYAAEAAWAATDAVIDSIRAEMTARNSARGLDAIANEARQMIVEARLTYTRLSLRVGKLLGGGAKRGNELVANQPGRLPPEYWYDIVKGASTLCRRDLYSVQRERLEWWLKY